MDIEAISIAPGVIHSNAEANAEKVFSPSA